MSTADSETNVANGFSAEALFQFFARCRSWKLVPIRSEELVGERGRRECLHATRAARSARRSTLRRNRRLPRAERKETNEPAIRSWSERRWNSWSLGFQNVKVSSRRFCCLCCWASALREQFLAKIGIFVLVTFLDVIVVPTPPYL
jgi:hypothetical protein